MTTILDRSGRALARARSLGRAAILLAAAALMLELMPASEAAAKTPGSTYCFNSTCHRVRTIAETAAMVGRTEQLATSFYDDCRRDRYNPCGLTSSGEKFRADTPDNAASPVYPDGTMLLVFNPATQRAAVVRVNNAGPYWGNRKLDVSRATAERLGFKGRGVARLQVKVLKAPSKAEATYRRNRKYEPVAGYLGSFASLEAAEGGLTAVAALQAATTAVRMARASLPGRDAVAALDLSRPVLTGATGPKLQLLDPAPRSPSAIASKKKRMRTAASS